MCLVHPANCRDFGYSSEITSWHITETYLNLLRSCAQVVFQHLLRQNVASFFAHTHHHSMHLHFSTLPRYSLCIRFRPSTHHIRDTRWIRYQVDSLPLWIGSEHCYWASSSIMILICNWRGSAADVIFTCLCVDQSTHEDEDEDEDDRTPDSDTC